MGNSLAGVERVARGGSPGVFDEEVGRNGPEKGGHILSRSGTRDSMENDRECLSQPCQIFA